MKVKEIDRTANIAWSPATHHPIYLAAGTAAQQLDATFSTTAALEIYALNLTEPGLDMYMKGSAVSDFRFHKIVWGCEGMKSSELSSGVIVGGADGGNIMIYDAAKLIKGDAAILHHNTKHTGSVHSLDFNKFQDCLLASGASESEIFIWDLNNPTSPVTLGAKSQPPEDVTCVAWNCQVQHILASTFSARCVVWDLRKNEPIIKVSDSSSRLRCKVVAWHPEVATQLCLASEDDHSPIIQLWDLRFATSPLKTLDHHQRGVLSIAWCLQDPDLLLSCGKDNRILCWNPNSNAENGEVLCELPTGNQWSFDVAWCPRNPAIIANSSCDGHVGVFSLMGGQQQVHCSSKIAESFPGSEKLTEPLNVDRHISVPLQKPPKWIRKPVGASFGFGGKLVIFGNAMSEMGPSRFIHIRQLVTEPELLRKSDKLESSLTNGNLVEFCHSKVESSQNEQERITWSFLQATFSGSPRKKMLSLLGYDSEKITAEINTIIKDKGGLILEQADLTDQMLNSSKCDVYGSDISLAFDNIAISAKENEDTLVIQTDPGKTDGLIGQALLIGNIPSAVEICINDGRWADALVLAQAGGLQLLQKTQKMYFKSVNSTSCKLISAVVTSDWVSLIKKCNISCWKEMLAAILTYAKTEDFSQLCELLGRRLEKECDLKENASLCYIIAGNLELLAQAWDKMHSSQDVDALQCLIEKVMILRKAVEQLSGALPPLQTGILSSLLGQYAQVLATQGSLGSAATYLVDPNERTLAVLRDRIYQALGHPSPHFPFQHVNVRRSSVKSQVSSHMQSVRKPSLPLQTPQQQFSYGSLPSNVSNTYSNAITSVPHQPLVPPSSTPLGMNQAPSSLSPAAPPSDAAQTPKSSSGLHHLSHRHLKHLHDPSVYSETSFSSQPFYQPQMPEMLPAQQPVPNFYVPEMSGGTSTLPYSSVASNVSFPTAPYTSYMQSSQAVPQSTAAPVPVAAPLPSCYSEMKPGWNDPPPLKQSSLKTQNLNYEPAVPITSPFPDAPVSQPVNQGGYFVPSLPPQPHQPVLGMNVTDHHVPSQQPDEMNIISQTLPDQPKEKGPIPPEHQILQDTFEDLRRQCQQKATNPQMRRKLDDVAKKLENLYDKLRDNTLSNPVTYGLHEIVQSVMQSDYPTALAIHGQLVQNANFSEISGFMPSIKVLLQTASQLGVFLQ